MPVHQSPDAAGRHRDEAANHLPNCTGTVLLGESLGVLASLDHDKKTVFIRQFRDFVLTSSPTSRLGRAALKSGKEGDSYCG